ncbi:hypothetical protein JVU11DRAFT_888 [Chiua virens]|nr:hypothetical protein JVU11DRAFT_888 [Chiua virens]
MHLGTSTPCLYLDLHYHASVIQFSIIASLLIYTVVFCYLLALVFIAASRYSEDPRIWYSDVRVLRVTVVSQWSPSPPSSPYSTRFKKRTDVDVFTPQPVRARPPQFLHHHGFGLATDYEIEPFRPVFASPEHMDVHLPEAIPLPPSATAPVVPSYMKPTHPLPDLNQFDRPRELVSTITYGNSGAPSEPVTRQSNTLPSPSLLGDWPRRDIMKQPAKLKRMPPPPSAFEFPNRHVPTVAPNDRPVTSEGGPVTPHRPRRPSGPRSRVPSVESVHRPAPLDLSEISNYVTRRQDDTGLNG